MGPSLGVCCANASSSNSTKSPFSCVQPVISASIADGFSGGCTQRRISRIQDKCLDKKLNFSNALFERIFNGDSDICVSLEKRGVDVEYKVYAKQHSDFWWRKIGYFKPSSLEYGSPSYILLQKGSVSYLRAAYPPGLGILRECAAFAMNELVGGRFFVPTTLPVHVDGIGDGLMKLLPKSNGHLEKPACQVYQSRLLFNLITMNPFFGQLASVRSTPGSNGGNFAFFSHNSYVLPDTKQVLNTTLLAFRDLNAPCMEETFSESTQKLVQDVETSQFDAILQRMQFPSHVQFYVRVAIETIRECVLERAMKPAELVRFMYTAQPIAFIPSVLHEIDVLCPLGSNIKESMEQVRFLRYLALQKIETRPVKCGYSSSTAGDYRRLLRGFL